jgi:hypothetical protein
MKWRRETPYNFINLFDDVLTVIKEIMDYAANKRNLLGFLLFFATGIISILVVIPISLVILSFLHTIDLSFVTILEKTSAGMNKDESQVIQGLAVLTALLFVLPVLVFYTPSIIYSYFKERREKKRVELEQRVEMAREQVLRSWSNCMPPPPQSVRTVKTQDFIPKNYLVPHNFKTGRVIIPGITIQTTALERSSRRGRVRRGHEPF